MNSSGAPFVVFVIGAPGSGKGTLCSKLARQHDGLCHISVGDLLRARCADTKQSADPKVVKHVREGTLVDAKTIAAIVRESISTQWLENGQKLILIDGFPRKLEQAYALGNSEGREYRSFPEEQRMGKQIPAGPSTIGEPNLVLYFNCPKEVALGRYLTRKLDTPRDNDPGIFEKRYREFEELNPEILEAYQSAKILIEIDTSGDTETSYKELLMGLERQPEWRKWTGGELIEKK